MNDLIETLSAELQTNLERLRLSLDRKDQDGSKVRAELRGRIHALQFAMNAAQRARYAADLKIEAMAGEAPY